MGDQREYRSLARSEFCLKKYKKDGGKRESEAPVGKLPHRKKPVPFDKPAPHLFDLLV